MKEQFFEYLPFIIPLFILQLGLAIGAVVHILRHDSYRVGNRWLWLIVSIFVNILGPILYFTIGRDEDA